MKRRNFLKIPAIGSLAFFMKGMPIKALADASLQLADAQLQKSGRVMVLIQLNGGNDGLNTIIPLDQYSPLSSLRSNVLIPENKILSLSGMPNTGMHPAMTAIRGMYNDGLVNIVQSAGYSEPNFSHFRSSDIWATASDSDQFLDTGWMGRYLDNVYSGYPSGYPNNLAPDPLAIQIGTGVSSMFQGPNANMAYAVANVNSFYNVVNNSVGATPNNASGHELSFIRNIAMQTHSYTGSIQSAAQHGHNAATYPTNNPLADQLKVVAQLISGGLRTSIYVVTMNGFDTHSVQVDSSDHTKGAHTDLLTKLSEAIGAFFTDCKQLGIDERVAAMTFSEFGRRIMSNASGGTDHGSAAPVMVFGKGVNPGIIGSNPLIPTGTTVNDNISMQYDYRSIYASILTDWFQLTPQVTNNILLKDYDILPIFRGGTATTAVQETIKVSAAEEMLGQNYPNPFSKSTTININAPGGMATIELFDISGRLLRIIAQESFSPGTHQLTVDRNELPVGNYILRMTAGSQQSSRKMLIVD